MDRNTWAWAFASFGGAVMGVIFTIGVTSWAEDSELDTGDRALPYNGVLEFNGTAFTGPADVRFRLTDDDQCDYTEDHEDVQVFAGQFSVSIGTVDVQNNPLPNCIFDADRVFLEMSVRGGAEETDHVRLAGRQRINPVPFAYWAAEGSDFKIDGDINVTVNANIGGDMVAGGNASVGTSNVRPPSGQPRFELRHNVADTVDNFNDFQLVMWRGGTPVDTFGQGIQNGTMFFNVPSANQYVFYRGGTTNLLTLRDPTSTLNSALNVSGNINAPSLTGIGSINSGGAALAAGGDFSVGGNLSVTGQIRPSVGSQGINWPDNFHGVGSGDDAWIEYINEGGENTALRLGVGNDADDDIQLYQQGAVRLSVSNTTVNVSNDLSAPNNVWGASTTRAFSNPYGRAARGASCPNGYYVTGIDFQFSGTCQSQCNADGAAVESVTLTCRKL